MARVFVQDIVWLNSSPHLPTEAVIEDAPAAMAANVCGAASEVFDWLETRHGAEASMFKVVVMDRLAEARAFLLVSRCFLGG